MTHFHSCYSIGGNTLRGINRRHKDGVNSLTALKHQGCPPRRGTGLRDLGQTFRPWHLADSPLAVRHHVELCFTPTNVSWVEPIEAHFKVLR
jgi:hypothetical protein